MLINLHRIKAIGRARREGTAHNHQLSVAVLDLATVLYLALPLERPLLLEGEAGVGKTAVGATLARVLNTELIRLQCYEGIDAATALYEWDYPRQMLEIRLLESRGQAKSVTTRDIFTEEVLDRVRRNYILRRMGTATEIANAVVFLASDAASFITGQTLSVSGGYTMI